jgi:hypothetical protein
MMEARVIAIRKAKTRSGPTVATGAVSRFGFDAKRLTDMEARMAAAGFTDYEITAELEAARDGQAGFEKRLARLKAEDEAREAAGLADADAGPGGTGDVGAEYVPFERIRRITGYLVGTTERFNNGKRAEEQDRVKHGMVGAY